MADNNPSPNSNIHITPGPWQVEESGPYNNYRYVIKAGYRTGGSYMRVAVASSSPRSPEEDNNAQAIAALPELLAVVNQAPLPPTRHMSDEQMKQWVGNYRDWHQSRCSALARATESVEDIWEYPQVDIDNLSQVLCKELQLGGGSLTEVKFLIQATPQERDLILLPQAKRRKYTVATYPGYAQSITYHRGEMITIELTPVWIKRQLVLFWHPTSDVVSHERIREWFEVMFPHITTWYKATHIGAMLDQIRDVAKQQDSILDAGGTP